MRAKYSKKFFTLIIVCGIMLGLGSQSLASGPVNNDVVIFDVTDTSFSVLWRVDGPSKCDLELYDASDNPVNPSLYGKYNDSTNVGESALYSGYSKAEEHGVMVVSIYNLPKSTKVTTEYHIRTKTIPMSGVPIIYPPKGNPALAVTTMITPIDPSGLPSMPPAKNGERWLEVYGSDGQPAEGAIALMYIDGASYPVSYSKPAEMKDSWVAQDGLVSINLKMVYNANDNASFLELFNESDAAIDATVKVYGGDLGLWERRVEDFWGKTDDLDDLLYDGVNYQVTLETTSAPVITIENLPGNLVLPKSETPYTSANICASSTDEAIPAIKLAEGSPSNVQFNETGNGCGTITISWDDSMENTQKMVTVVASNGDGEKSGTFSFTLSSGKPGPCQVRIVPLEAKTGDALYCEVTSPSANLQGDTTTVYKFEWMKNGNPTPLFTEEKSMAAHISSLPKSTLAANKTQEGDKIKCKVTPYDNDGSGQSIETSAITIQNTPPNAPAAAIITPAEPAVDQDLVCGVTPAAVPDQDTGDVITYTYTWKSTGASTKSETHGPKPETTDILNASKTAAGEIWTCEVKAYDESTIGSVGVVSNPVSIANKPPTKPANITITIPGSANPVSEVKISENSSLICKVSSASVDPEGSTVQYKYTWKSNGKSIPHGPKPDLTDSLSLLSTGVNAKKGEKWTCEVRAYDQIDYSEPSVSNVVTIINSPPKKPEILLVPDPAAVYADDEIRCIVTTGAPDADGDSVKYTYTWSRAGIDPIIHTNQGAFDILDPASSMLKKGQVWKCTVVPNDGEDGAASIIEFEILNKKPNISEIPKQQWYEGGAYEIEMTAEDADGDELSYEAHIPANCEWINFDVNTHSILANPPVGSSGNYSVTIIVSDGLDSDEAKINITVGYNFVIIDDFEYEENETLKNNNWDELQIGYGEMSVQEDEDDPANHHLSMHIISPQSTQDENAHLKYAIAKWLNNPDQYNYPELQFDIMDDDIFYFDAYVGARDKSGKTVNYFLRYVPDDGPDNKLYEVFGNRVTYYLGSEYRESGEINSIVRDLEKDLYDAIYDVMGREVRYLYLIAIVLRGEIDYLDNIYLRPGIVDKTPPLEVVGLIPLPMNGAVKLSWQINPDQDSDVLGYRIYKNGTLFATVAKNVTQYLIDGLNNNVEYTFRVSAIDNAREPNESTGITKVAIPKKDETPPKDVKDFSVESGNKMVTLSWSDPEDQFADLAGYKIYKDSVDYTRAVTGSDIIDKSTEENRSTTVAIYGLTNGVLYTFTVFAVDQSGNLSKNGVSKPAMPIAGNDAILDDFDTDYRPGDSLSAHGWSHLHGDGTFTRIIDGTGYLKLVAASSNPLDFIISKWVAYLENSGNPMISFKVRSNETCRVEFYVKGDDGKNYFLGYRRAAVGTGSGNFEILQDKWIIYDVEWDNQNVWQTIERNLDMDLYTAINVHFSKILGIVVRGSCEVDEIKLKGGILEIRDLTARPGDGHVVLSWTLAINNKDNEAFNLYKNGTLYDEIAIDDVEDLNNIFVFSTTVDGLTNNEEYAFRITHLVGGEESPGVSIKAVPRGDYCSLSLFNDESSLLEWEIETQSPEEIIKQELRYDSQVQSSVMSLVIDENEPYPQRFMVGREVPVEYKSGKNNFSVRLKANDDSDFIIWFSLKGEHNSDYWIALLPAHEKELVGEHNNYGIFAYYYLNSELRDNKWHSLSIDLNEILETVMDDTLLEINEIYFGGRISIDDVILY
ncbi:MAG: fibronectin type III domain-containing protein [bacterium]